MELEDLEGLVESVQLQWLRARARDVPREQAIVELGSYLGQSGCWIGTGSAEGNGAHLTCIDSWIHPADDGHEISQVVSTFMRVIAEAGIDHLVTPLRANSFDVAKMWLRPVGMLFIDADHEAVFSDCSVWLPHVALGGWVALHDYDLKGYPETRRVVDEMLVTSGAFADVELVGGYPKMWTARLIRPW